MVEKIQYLRQLVVSGGPEPHEYDQVSSCFRAIMRSLQNMGYSKQEMSLKINELASSLGDAFSLDTTQGFVLHKPHGYPGDFELIDRIYKCHTSSRADLAKWDHFAHTRRSNQAVRNRKEYFINYLADRSKMARDDSVFRILNVGSGPARDVCEFLDRHHQLNVRFDCVDQDPKAVMYAKSVCKSHLERITFKTANIFRFNPIETYSVIWSSGLFDYLDDRAFKFLLKKLCMFVSPGGEIVIGNFSPLNPDQEYMAFGGWELKHRTSDQLRSLVSECGIESWSISVSSEQEGINLFLHIKSPMIEGKP